MIRKLADYCSAFTPIILLLVAATLFARAYVDRDRICLPGKILSAANAAQRTPDAATLEAQAIGDAGK